MYSGDASTNEANPDLGFARQQRRKRPMIACVDHRVRLREVAPAFRQRFRRELLHARGLLPALLLLVIVEALLLRPRLRIREVLIEFVVVRRQTSKAAISSCSRSTLWTLPRRLTLTCIWLVLEW